MADSNCKCFLNDQLLPVRAGCEAIWCKDVNSHTAIRDEALVRIAGLQRQLQQAQEERDIEQQGRQGAERQRDQAIGRTEAAEVLAERLRPYARHTFTCDLFHFDEGAKCTCGLAEALTPAEALRVEHRSPQSGQARQEGGEE